jgi:hypothetical protein
MGPSQAVHGENRLAIVENALDPRILLALKRISKAFVLLRNLYPLRAEEKPLVEVARSWLPEG